MTPILVVTMQLARKDLREERKHLQAPCRLRTEVRDRYDPQQRGRCISEQLCQITFLHEDFRSLSGSSCSYHPLCAAKVVRALLMCPLARSVPDLTPTSARITIFVRPNLFVHYTGLLIDRVLQQILLVQHEPGMIGPAARSI